MAEKLRPHEILADPKNLRCICPDTACKWHGNCRDCMALHRYHATIPNCLEMAMGFKACAICAELQGATT